MHQSAYKYSNLNHIPIVNRKNTDTYTKALKVPCNKVKINKPMLNTGIDRLKHALRVPCNKIVNRFKFRNRGQLSTDTVKVTKIGFDTYCIYFGKKQQTSFICDQCPIKDECGQLGNGVQND